MKKIKIGVVPYMNARPLIYGLEDNKTVIELRFAVPALLPEMLRRGEIDVALVPSIEYFRDGNFLIIPDIAIASKGEVKSVKLLVRSHHLSLRGVSSNVIARSEATWQSCSKEIASPASGGLAMTGSGEAQNDKGAFHPENIRTIALDTASNTSCALSRIIMSEKYHRTPAFTHWNPNPPSIPPLVKGEGGLADAFLVIGDNALKTNGANCSTIDLGKEWQDMTHLPFVYAFWVTKRETKIPCLNNILQEAKSNGLSKLEELAVMEAKRLDLPLNECFNYLSKNICYDLGEKELSGLKTFYRYAVKMGMAKEGIDIEFCKA